MKNQSVMEPNLILPVPYIDISVLLRINTMIVYSDSPFDFDIIYYTVKRTMKRELPFKYHHALSKMSIPLKRKPNV